MGCTWACDDLKKGTGHKNDEDLQIKSLEEHAVVRLKGYIEGTEKNTDIFSGGTFMNTNNIFERIREQFSEMAGSTQEYQRLLELLKQMEGKFGINRLTDWPHLLLCGIHRRKRGTEKSLQPE